MRLSSVQEVSMKDMIKKAVNIEPLIFSNGTFQFYGLSEHDADAIIKQLRNALYVDDIIKLNDKFSSDPSRRFQVIGTLIEDLSLCEDIELHDSLNPKLWDSDNNLLPEVIDKAEEIVALFVDQLKEDGIDLIVDDIVIVGSNANYNYTKESDLDIHIIADESFDCSDKHLDIIYNAYKALFNSKYDITINGINTEIYVENKADIARVSSGVYSIKNGWIQNPSRHKIPKIDESAVEKTLQELETEYLDIIEKPELEAIDAFIDKLYELRTAAIKSDGEFGVGNLVFKEFRHLGYLDDLKDLKIQLINKQLSLN